MTIHAGSTVRLDRPPRSGLPRAPRRRSCPPPVCSLSVSSGVVVPEAADPFILETTFKMLVAAMYTSYACRPRGWSLRACLDVRESTIPGAGQGVFATTSIKRGQVLGAYPGVPRTDHEMTAKALVVPTSRFYVFSVRPGVILDPTGEDGLPSAHPVPARFWWPFDVDCTLAYVNEPSLGLGVNVAVEDDASDASGLCFVADRDIQEGEELFIDYGVSYDRRGYGE